MGTLVAPSITGATAGAGTVALSWTPVSAPAGAAVTYYVTRAGGTVGGNCPSSSTTATTVTSCTDSGLSKGSYSYTVTAIWQSWSKTSAATPVSVGSGALARFTVTAPASATAGTAFSATVTAQDAAGNTVTAFTGSQASCFFRSLERAERDRSELPELGQLLEWRGHRNGHPLPRADHDPDRNPGLGDRDLGVDRGRGGGQPSDRGQRGERADRRAPRSP